ncbi:MAG TPA: glycosyltransferase family 4 protein [Terriglobales bacterium]|nr:glycosyltransferase family 4 protein [Terriglobales bacterium]
MKIAYLTNGFPSAVEAYVRDEIAGLRAHDVEVIACSARRVGVLAADLDNWREQTLYIQALRVWVVLRSFVRCCSGCQQLLPFLVRILSGNESITQRTKALVHTWLGVYYAVLLQDTNVDHIHVHHGYFSAWIAMVAARLLGISYSITLHGSDLLVNAAFLDIKLERCSLCFTISEYNRQVAFNRYPQIPREKILLRRLGVDLPAPGPVSSDAVERDHRFIMLAPGRLHAVKDHAFLVSACAVLRECGFDFVCFLAGEGPERKHIQNHIRAQGLERQVKLLGHVAHEDLQAIYGLADLVVLTSKSEGIPVVLMEAMAHGCAVLAPDITGIPELVTHGKTGFLYKPGCLGDFVACIEFVRRSLNGLGPMRRAARDHVSSYFNRAANLKAFIEVLCTSLCAKDHNENPVLQ